MSSRRPLAAAVATAFAFAAPVASAQTSVTLYGVLDTFVGQITNDVPGTGKSRSEVVNSGGFLTSFFGVRGAEDLGGGLRAVFALESFMRVDGGEFGRFGGDAFWSRAAFVGLESGSFGRVTLGRNTTPYFLATLIYNPLVDSFVFGPMITHVFRGALQGDTGASNSVRWTSPSWGGVRADVLYSLGSEGTSGPDRDFGKSLDASLSYVSGAFGVSAAYRMIDLTAGGNGREQNAFLVGASYDFKVAKLFAQYQSIDESFNASASDIDRETFQVGVSVPIGSGVLLASYASSSIDDLSAATPSKRDTWAIAYRLALSNRTELYAAYYMDTLKEPTGTEQTVVALGLQHRF